MQDFPMAEMRERNVFGRRRRSARPATDSRRSVLEGRGLLGVSLLLQEGAPFRGLFHIGHPDRVREPIRRSGFCLLSGTEFLAETFQKVFHRLFPLQRQSMGPSCIPGGIIGRGAEILKPVSVPRSGLPFSAEGKISAEMKSQKGRRKGCILG